MLLKMVLEIKASNNGFLKDKFIPNLMKKGSEIQRLGSIYIVWKRIMI